jgi:hypothetical protein
MGALLTRRSGGRFARRDSARQARIADTGGDRERDREVAHLLAKPRPPPSRETVYAKFCCACDGGVGGLMHFVDKFELTGADVVASDALLLALRFGHLSAAEWLITLPAKRGQQRGTPVLDARLQQEYMIVIERAFCFACGHGHTEEAKWLADRFPAEYVAQSPQRAAIELRRAQAAPSSPSVVENVDFDGRYSCWHDVPARVPLRRVAGRALRNACVGGHLAIAEWLVAAVCPTLEAADLEWRALWRADVEWRTGDMFAETVAERVCGNGDATMLQWLVEFGAPVPANAVDLVAHDDRLD